MDTSRYKDLFLGEANELVAQIEVALVELDADLEDRAKVRDVFRLMHTLKGNAGTMGLETIARLTHAVEDALDLRLQNQTPLSRTLLQALLESLDAIKVLLENFRCDRAEDLDISRFIENLNGDDGSSGGNVSPQATAPVAIMPAPAAPMVRLGLNKLDSILNMVEELTIVKARLLAQSQGLRSSALTDEVKGLDRLIKQLQSETLEARLISAADIFQGYRRVVRDTARQLGKEVNFIIEDNGISFDRVLLDKINEPLIHMLRNSLDHGLEDAQTRVSGGKPAAGTLTLKARREQGYAIVEVIDDGRGIDAAELKAHAVKKGFITSTAAETMTEASALQLIFLPNLSTKNEVTELSGRGVGMDVVQRVIESINGRIEISTRLHFGTTIALYLPLNLAILQALIVKAGGQVFAAPMSDVLEIFSFESVYLAAIENEPVIRLRGEVIPVIDLARKFGLPHVAGDVCGIVVQSKHGKIALRVNAVAGRQEIVVKNFNGFLRRVSGLNSATIMGDGRVVLILDVRELQ